MNKIIRTTAVFKCVVTLRNGMHKIVRMTIDKVAQFAAAMRQIRESPWLTARYEQFFDSIDVDWRQIRSCKFINERTMETLIEI